MRFGAAHGVEPMARELQAALGTLGINLEPGWRSLWVDLASLMNPTPYTAQACVPGPISRA